MRAKARKRIREFSEKTAIAGNHIERNVTGHRNTFSAGISPRYSSHFTLTRALHPPCLGPQSIRASRASFVSHLRTVTEDHPRYTEIDAMGRTKSSIETDPTYAYIGSVSRARTSATLFYQFLSAIHKAERNSHKPNAISFRCTFSGLEPLNGNCSG